MTPLAVETRVLATVAAARSPALTTAGRVVTRLGDLSVVVVLAAIVALLARRSPARIHLLLLASVGGSIVITSVLKAVTARPRPTGALASTLTSAYPSGHALRAVAVYGLAAWACHRYLRAPALRYIGVVATVAVIVAIAASRIYLGVHWPSDVVAGSLIGGVWLIAVLRTLPPAGASAPVEPGSRATRRGV